MNPNTEEEFGKLFNSMRPAGQGDESKHQKLTANKRFWGGGLRDHLASTAPPKKTLKLWMFLGLWMARVGNPTPHRIHVWYSIFTYMKKMIKRTIHVGKYTIVPWMRHGAGFGFGIARKRQERKTRQRNHSRGNGDVEQRRRPWLGEGWKKVKGQLRLTSNSP